MAQISNMPKLSSRAQKALDVLADGGRFVNRLERDSYTGREQFHRRLITRPGAWDAVVKGVGHAAFQTPDALEPQLLRRLCRGCL
jgi:hypothetical protein